MRHPRLFPGGVLPVRGYPFQVRIGQSLRVPFPGYNPSRPDYTTGALSWPLKLWPPERVVSLRPSVETKSFPIWVVLVVPLRGGWTHWRVESRLLPQPVRRLPSALRRPHFCTLHWSAPRNREAVPFQAASPMKKKLFRETERGMGADCRASSPSPTGPSGVLSDGPLCAALFCPPVPPNAISTMAYDRPGSVGEFRATQVSFFFPFVPCSGLVPLCSSCCGLDSLRSWCGPSCCADISSGSPPDFVSPVLHHPSWVRYAFFGALFGRLEGGACSFP